jgi:hypothetical protein
MGQCGICFTVGTAKIDYKSIFGKAEQKTMRLYATGNVDGFLFAIGKVY